MTDAATADVLRDLVIANRILARGRTAASLMPIDSGTAWDTACLMEPETFFAALEASDVPWIASIVQDEPFPGMPCGSGGRRLPGPTRLTPPSCSTTRHTRPRPSASADAPLLHDALDKAWDLDWRLAGIEQQGDMRRKSLAHAGAPNEGDTAHHQAQNGKGRG